MRQLPLEKTLELIEKLEPQIIGSSIYDKYKNEITTEKIVCLATLDDISITTANATMILKSIMAKDLLKNIPRYTKKANHPVYGSPKTIKQITNWQTKKLEN